ncbi:LEAF RUST 10 DISEASE-RESISTANCE LOCUS RECEPTOR-LIKE PROTEIN KINASE-like 1.2 isoform X3 [Triticum urartu]|uniref:LEAF RUST 10 DISEASE-RESISTANCE LOCUS RECEPTOR-LIKE PROTEIN KINASE-like 1.2 isoform X3 n=1 Tax=Triticum urartu TaxID=4572 RepID=UPI00204433DF|nr:LEAF RUST 10 DISEASE-RESISTANCE LOCUS RECEPTOR-LIKE PROTEIN KINASE-like 1.2 isoform X3 [Triticum urartu]
MPLLICHRLLLLLLLWVAASHGDSSDDGAYDPSMCLNQTYTCGDVRISYPFYLVGKTKDLRGNDNSYCGYPGLGILCDDDKPILQLSGIINYTIKSVDGATATVSLADPAVDDDRNTCPRPRIDRNITLQQGSLPYFSDSTVDYLIFFINCTFYPPSDIHPIGCQSFYGGLGLGPSFVLPDDAVPSGNNWAQACSQVIELPVHKSPPINHTDPAWTNGGYAKLLRQEFQLGWNEIGKPTACTQCEGANSKGRCGHNRTGDFIGCLCPDGRVHSVCNSTDVTGSNKKRSVTIAGVVAGVGGALLVAAVMVFLFICKRRQRKVVNSSSKLLKYRYSGSGGTPTRSRGGDMESGSSQDMGNRFSYEELEEATDSFNENRELGDGGFGTVYKGYLGDGRVVAVKRLYNNSYRRVEQFVNEAAILARLRHPNLVMFYGCTSKESRELLLVYEFVQNGTVADHLHGPRAAERALPWPLRLSIAVESAAALTYLHAIEPPIVHRDVKTNNILLDTDFHVKVADFGLSRLFPLDATHVSTAPQGTPGYVDPEYHQCYQLTDKSDVYSFGVVLVELISSKPAVDITRQRNEINLAGMAISKIQKCRLEELVDVELGYESDPAARKMMTMVAELAFRCLQQNGEMRPPIREVLDVLRAIQDDCLGHKDGGGKGKKDFAEPFSPNTVHAPWDSRNTTPNTSQ